MDYPRYRHLPNTLRRHRRALGLTQKEVGERLHIDPDWISHWESGDSLYRRSKRFWKYTRNKVFETFVVVKTLKL
jgi:transcriptional regulator with XRE-family HTH domain